MSKLFSGLAGPFGLVGPSGKKKKRLGEARRQAQKVGAKIGKPSERAREASEREFETQTVSELLGGNAGAGFGSSRPKARKPLRAR